MCTVQQQPAVVSNNLITFAGSVLPTLSPPNLQAVLTSPTGALTQLQTIRDADVNSLNELFKSTGNTAQRAMLDQYALSQTEARACRRRCFRISRRSRARRAPIRTSPRRC